MKVVWLLVGLILLQDGIAAVTGGQALSVGRPKVATDRETDWENVDYARLRELILSRGLGAQAGELDRLLRYNLPFVYSNHYKRDRFLVEPKPQHFVETVTRILELNGRVNELIAQGRKLVVQPYDEVGRKKSRRLVDQISEAARKLRGAFQANFVDIHGTTYDVSYIRASGQESFKFYVVQANRINHLLSERLNDYFFNSALGAVSVPDYQEASVNVLALALIRLGDLNQPRM